MTPPSGSQARMKQGLEHVDIAESRDPALIEQKGFDLPAGLSQPAPEPIAVEGRTQRVAAQSS